jgi:CelD/BcsL family acetyltransferase involved in cellulose biosynthesis
MNLTTRTVVDDRQFNALEKDWEGLAARAIDSTTFITHAWLNSWWTAYRPRATLCIVLAESSLTLCGIAPLMLVRQGALAGAFRRLRFIGDGTSETDHMNFVVSSDHRASILACLLDEIDRLPWDIAHFNNLPESSPNATQLLQHAKERGWLVTVDRVLCPRRTLPGSYEELLKSLPSRLRTAIRSARRDLETKHTVDFGLHQQHEDLGQALEVLFRNHGERWRAKGESGVFDAACKRAFYTDLSSRLLRSGALRFFYLKVDGKIVAQQFCFEHSRTVMLLQEGFDIAYAKKNVGNVLRAMVFEHLIGAGTKVYDFLEGTSRHKLSWCDGETCDLIVRACRPNFVGRVAYHLPRWIRRLRGQAESGATTTPDSAVG